MEQVVSSPIIFILSEHPLLGWLITPYIYDKTREEGVYRLSEQAFHLNPEEQARLQPAEQELITVAGCCIEKKLMTAYSKEKVVAKFLHKLSEDSKLCKLVRSYVEKKVHKIFEIIIANDFPLYLREDGSKLIYPHHLLKVHRQEADISFHFSIDEQLFCYSLACSYQGNPLQLTQFRPVATITHSPAILLLEREIYVFRHIEASRLIPFTKKDRVCVDAALTEKYIDNILLPIARFYKVDLKGMALIDDKFYCNPRLYLEDTIYGKSLLRLTFRYGDNEFEMHPEEDVLCYPHAEKEGKDFDIHYFKRDYSAEREAFDNLLNNGLKLVADTYFDVSETATEKTVSEWLTNHLDFLTSNYHLIDSITKKDYCLEKIYIEQSCDENPDWFDLHITVVIGELRIPFRKFRKNILAEDRNFTLPDGRIILLPEEWFSKYSGLMELGKDNGNNIRIKRSMVGLRDMALISDIKTSGSLSWNEKTYPLPPSLKATLRPYQLKGFYWMKHLYEENWGGCLADDMGLGKTVQTLTILQSFYERENGIGGQEEGGTDENRKNPSLIVVPTSLKHNWAHEIKRFTRLSFMEFGNAGPLPKVKQEMLIRKRNLVLVSYGMMRNNIDLLCRYDFEYVILDESQIIKNSESITFRSAIRLKGKHRLVLTGTPIENSLKDLWAQFHFIQPDLLSDESEFSNRFITPIRQGNVRKEMQLKQLITPFILRRNKEEVAPDLPPLTEEFIYCEMSNSQRLCYEKEKNSLRNVLLDREGNVMKRNTLNMLNGILRLREMACHPRLVMPDYEADSGKLTQMKETFETLKSEGHKVLIFSSFVKHLEIIAEAFKQEGWKYALLTGATTNRPEEIARFSESDDIQAFLISLKAGGVGLNLTQADYVFIADPWWNPAAEAQAIARAHRIGQEKQVIAYRFIVQDSIEEKIMLLQQHKRKMVETFITDTDAVSTLTDDEWRNLLL